MKKLIIRNYNFIVTIEENGIKKEVDASYEFFNNYSNNKFLDNFLKYFYNNAFKLNKGKFTLNYCLAFFKMYKYVPKFTIVYDNLDIELTIFHRTSSLEKLPSDEEINKLIKKETRLNEDDNFTTTYECEDEIDLAIATLYHYIKGGKTLKKCCQCNKYFLTKNRNDEKCCYRVNNENKTCKEIQKNTMQKINESKQETRERKNAFNRLDRRISRAKTDEERKKAQEKLNAFYEIVDLKKEAYINGTITLNEYISWLKSL